MYKVEILDWDIFKKYTFDTIRQVVDISLEAGEGAIVTIYYRDKKIVWDKSNLLDDQEIQFWDWVNQERQYV